LNVTNNIFLLTWLSSMLCCYTRVIWFSCFYFLFVFVFVSAELIFYVVSVNHMFIEKLMYHWIDMCMYYKAISWRTVKKHPQAVSRRRTDNTIAKWIRTKGQTMIHKTMYSKLRIEEYQPHDNTETVKITKPKMAIHILG
jgi:hypothetical protein